MDDREALVNEVDEEDIPREPENKQKNNLAYVSFNFVNSIIGSGIIGMPYAMKKAGLGLGIILLVVVALISDYSLVLLVKAGQLSGTSNYQDLVQASFGRIGFYLLSFMQFTYPFIAMISYNVIIGDTVTKVFKRMFMGRQILMGNRYFVVFIISALITLPLSLSKDIARLARVSMASLCFVMFLLVIIIARAITLAHVIKPTDGAWRFANTGVLESLGIMVFAFMCHHNSFLLYDSLYNPTQSRWNMVTHMSVLISAVVTLIFGVGGYVIFTGYTEGDILENFCKDDDLINLTRFVYTITIMLTYPIECFVCREVLERVLFTFKSFSLSRHSLLTSVLVLMALLFSFATDCLGIVLEINGVLAAAPLAFIFPAMCYIRLAPLTQGPASESFRSLKWAWATLAFGVSVVGLGFVSVIVHLYKGVKCSHGHELTYCIPPQTEP